MGHYETLQKKILASLVARQAPDIELVLVPVYKNVEQIKMVGSGCWGIFKTTEYLKAASAWVNWMIEPENQGFYCSVTGFATPRDEAQKYWTSDPAVKDHVAFNLPHAAIGWDNNYWWQLQKVIGAPHWQAAALGIKTVLAATGDFVALGDQASTTTVRDVDVFALVRLAREAGSHTGVVLDPHPESNGLEQAVRRMERKVEAGAQFAVTQPVYDEASAMTLAEATEHIGIPVILGILPLRTARHAEFLHHKVAGIAVSEHVRERMSRASDPVAEGVANAREMQAVARQHFAGACIMPPFDHYEVLFGILRPE